MNAETATEARPAPFDLLKVGSIISRRKKTGPDKKYATFNRRMMAATLDSLILLLPAPLFSRMFPVDIAALGVDGSGPVALQQLAQGLTNPAFFTSWLINLTAQMMLFCLFSAVCWHFWSATPGKMLLMIKIADAKTEKPITDRQIAIRICGYVVSSVVIFLGFFWIRFDKHRQGWHDKMADTVVLVVPWKEGLGRWFNNA